ncbi:MAG: DUF4926 domain-containing protein [Actinomycetota bacterium]|nr:DUF4926 domain-containing protein [Actinomycetota bacterium]
MDLRPSDVVTLPAGLPEHGVPEGATAVVLEVHYEPFLAYEIEVVDSRGRSLFVGAVDPVQVQLARRCRPCESESP